MVPKVSCYSKPCKMEKTVYGIALNAVRKVLQILECSRHYADSIYPVNISWGRRSTPHPYSYLVPLLQQPAHQPRAEEARSSSYETAHWLVTSCRLSTT